MKQEVTEVQRKEPFIGSWSLISYEHQHAQDGSLHHPLGKSVKGLLIYTAEGIMSGTLMRADRRAFSSHELFGGTIEEKATAFESCVHYGGRYQVHAQWVLHEVEFSLFPNWTGSWQRRFYRFIGSDQLELKTEPFVAQGIRQTAVVLWKRIS